MKKTKDAIKRQLKEAWAGVWRLPRGTAAHVGTRRLFFILPSIEFGWSSEHVYMAVSWLFWQYSVAFEL